MTTPPGADIEGVRAASQSFYAALPACLALRLSGLQGCGQKMPVRIHTRIEVIKVAANVGRLPTVEIKFSFSRVPITAACVPFEQLKRDQTIEEIAGAAIGN
jgi:hypothetical protein